MKSKAASGGGEQHAYSRHFNKEGTADSYIEKFRARIDRLRHRFEVVKVRAWANGNLFDCSIGTGRFVGQFPGVTKYSGMDFSEDFVRHVQMQHPSVSVSRGDLLVGIPSPDASYDTVLCMRTLSSLGSLDRILAEMSRICRRGGVVIFDYGTQSGLTEVEKELIPTSSADVSMIVSKLPLKAVAEYPLDGFLLMAKKSRLLSRILNRGISKVIPDMLLLGVEAISVRHGADRKLYVFEKIEGTK